MNLSLKRVYFGEFTLGNLSMDGDPFCDTLEDKVRTEKIPRETAIPAGRYEVKLTYSRRFKRVMPQLMNVPNFEGIRIHSGNTDKDTEGCILVGKFDGDHSLINSRDTYNDLMDELEKCKEPIYILIT